MRSTLLATNLQNIFLRGAQASPPNTFFFWVRLACCRSPARQLSVEKVEHQAGDLIPLVFEGEVSGVEQMKLGTR